MAASQLVNPDLANERLKATFDTEELTNFLYGGHEKTKRKRYLRKSTVVPYNLQVSCSS